MKKVIFLVMLLLSGLANANRVYDHVSAFISDPTPLGQGYDNHYFNLGFLATYSSQLGDEKKIYAAILGPNIAHKYYYLSEGSIVNKVKVYQFTNSHNITEDVGFIAMDGALYVWRNLNLASDQIKIISELNHKRINIIDVFQTKFGFVIVANVKGFFGGVSTQLYDMRLTEDGGYVLKNTGEISEQTTSSGYVFDMNVTPNLSQLVLASAFHRVFILEKDCNLNNFSPWKVSNKLLGEPVDKFTVLTSNAISKAVVLRYRTTSTTSGNWSINNNITQSNDFVNFSLGADNPSYFDYASYDELSNLIQNGIPSNHVNSFNTFNIIDPISGQIKYSLNGKNDSKLLSVSSAIFPRQSYMDLNFPRQIYLLNNTSPNAAYYLFEIKISVPEPRWVKFYDLPE